MVWLVDVKGGGRTLAPSPNLSVPISLWDGDVSQVNTSYGELNVHVKLPVMY